MHCSSPAGGKRIRRRATRSSCWCRKVTITLEQTTNWNTLGMRGTCSPGFKSAIGRPGRADTAGVLRRFLGPDHGALLAHPVGGALAGHRRRRGGARREPGRAARRARSPVRCRPGGATRQGRAQLQAVRHNWQAVAAEFDVLRQVRDGMQALLGLGWALKLNNLKVDVSESVVQIVHQALQITGILGYKNDSPGQRRPPLPRRAVGRPDDLPTNASPPRAPRCCWCSKT